MDQAGRPSRRHQPAPGRKPAGDRASARRPRAGEPDREQGRHTARRQPRGEPDREPGRRTTPGPPTGATRPGRPTAPPLPPDLSAEQLPREVLAELRQLPPLQREEVAAHLAAAGLLLDDKPELAHAHAAYARGRASRLPAVREAAGITAYRTGRYAEAINDLRAYARMSGDSRHLPLLADCERGLGRPERALALSRSDAAARLPADARVELRIVAAGARRDLGDVAGALVELRCPELDGAPGAQTARLWYAYADALLAAGQRDEAVRWFTAAGTADEDGSTDADLRIAELIESEPTDAGEPRGD